jgi:hypothetical protein
MCDDSVLTQEQLVERVHKGFAKKVQQEISIEEVRQTLKEIRLTDPPAKPTCRLQVERLVFCGQKSLASEPAAVPFNYDQKFSPGVNVVLVEDNDVGKSTILKTIKFALTGDDGDYDADVKKWIANVRLHFSMGDDQYTIAISRTPTDTGTFGLLLPGSDERPMGDLIKDDGVVFTAADQSEFQESLRRFFFDKIGLSRLGWALVNEESWDAYALRLDRRVPDAETDEVVDEIAAAAIDSPSPNAIATLMRAADLATGELTRRSVALALAVCAAPGMTGVVDALVGEFDASRDNAFLGPAMLDALFLLACRDGLARSELSSLLQRIDKTDNRFLVAKAATICGRLLQLRFCGELLPKLAELCDAPDELAACEARFQHACLVIHEVMSVSDRASLREGLNKAILAFKCVEMCAESRPDAHLMELLLESFVVIEKGAAAPEVDARLSSVREKLDYCWPGYESPSSLLFIAAVSNTVDSLAAALKAVNEAECWLDIRTALVSLARTTSALTCLNLGEHFHLVGSAIEGIWEQLGRPTIGKLLVRAIGRKRLEAAIGELNDVEGPRGAALRELVRLLDAVESDSLLVSPETGKGLERLMEATGRAPDELVHGLLNAVEGGDVGPWVESLVPGGVRLPVYPLSPYSSDPTVHPVVCALLEGLRSKLGPYDRAAWLRLVEVVNAIVRFAHLIRDELPDYCVCEEDGGKGRLASEADLRDDLFRDLRREFGTRCVFESGPVAGGRVDTGVRFDDGEFPIECKHEFSKLEREHIRTSYLGQPSDYASARQQVSFLLILDLRASNAAGHRDNVTTTRKGGKGTSRRALYTLRDSFWIESLSVDPDIEGARASIVVIGLFPGNRPRPSSQTRYSRRPAKAK